VHAVPDPQAVFARWHRALAVDGFLMFSTLGPGSLEGLRALYRDRGWPAPHAPFVDMHDLGDMLVAAGFADPVMDQELVTLTYSEPRAWLAELRSLGGNADPGRVAGLRTPRWRDRLGAAAVPPGGQGTGRLVFEVVYGHAFRPVPRARVTGETAVALDDLRTMARAGRRRDGRG
jgi:malonyl-CoA O-methyltransferase